MAGARSDYGINRYVEETKRLLGVLESQLSKTDYLVANKYSIADIASFCWASYAKFLEIDVAQFPGVSGWIERIEKREAVIKGKKVPGGGKSQEELGEMFANMAKKVQSMTNSDKH